MTNKKMYWLGAVMLLAAFAMIASSNALTPDGPSDVTIVSDSTKQDLPSQIVNTTGGSISVVNITGIIQNPRWKAFVGNVTGTFVLSDSADNRIYDWDLINITGKVYATRKTDTVSWPSISCASVGQVATENADMFHTKPEDNLTATFRDSTHGAFYVGAVSFSENQCGFSLDTYVESQSQSGLFEEILLHDQTIGGNGGMVYTTILEQDQVGFDGNTYDFQMIVPEVGSSGWTGSTAYYLYVEIGN